MGKKRLLTPEEIEVAIENVIQEFFLQQWLA